MDEKELKAIRARAEAADIPRLLDALDEELARNDLFSRCMHRALLLWKQQHPEANHWPDGADNIVWLLDEVERLRSENERLSSFEQRVIAAEERAEALKLENLNLEERALDAEEESEDQS